MFLFVFIQRSGGVEGFIKKIQKVLDKYEAKKSGNARIIVQLLAWLTGANTLLLYLIHVAHRQRLQRHHRLQWGHRPLEA